jgi:hypothetical protein
MPGVVVSSTPRVPQRKFVHPSRAIEPTGVLQSGCGNNWAVGYCDMGPLVERGMDRLRAEMEVRRCSVACPEGSCWRTLLDDRRSLITRGQKVLAGVHSAVMSTTGACSCIRSRAVRARDAALRCSSNCATFRPRATSRRSPSAPVPPLRTTCNDMQHTRPRTAHITHATRPIPRTISIGLTSSPLYLRRPACAPCAARTTRTRHAC